MRPVNVGAWEISRGPRSLFKWEHPSEPCFLGMETREPCAEVRNVHMDNEMRDTTQPQMEEAGALRAVTVDAKHTNAWFQVKKLHRRKRTIREDKAGSAKHGPRRSTLVILRHRNVGDRTDKNL